MKVAPVRERGLKYYVFFYRTAVIIRRSREGAWIEITFPLFSASLSLVAPVRERGLKYDCLVIFVDGVMSLP